MKLINLTDHVVSQWSLTFEVRKRMSCTSTRTVCCWSQWSLTFEVRKSEGIRRARVTVRPSRNGA